MRDTHLSRAAGPVGEGARLRLERQPFRPFRLDRYFRRHAFRARHVLCASDCQPWTVRELAALAPDLIESVLDCRLEYAPYEGTGELREAIATSLYPGRDADEILVTTGAQEAIFLLMHVLLQPGDRVVVQQPCYQSLYSVAQDRGIEVVPWRPVEGERWSYDLDELETLLTRPTRLLVVNSPHNPTGCTFDVGQWERLHAACVRRGAWLLSDEVYRGLETELPTGPAAWTAGAHAISVGDVSKSLGMPGLRVGWAATSDATLRAALEVVKDFTSIAVAGPSQVIATRAVRQWSAVVGRNLALLESNLASFERFLAEFPGHFAAPRGSGGPTRLVRWSGPGSAPAFCERLRETADVLLLPSSEFDYDDGHLRFGLGRRDVVESLARLRAFLHADRPEQRRAEPAAVPLARAHDA